MIKYKNYILLSLIIFIGFFLRIYNIENTPPGVYPDEAVNGIDAINAINGKWEWFYTSNNGREGLFINLIAICFKFFGISVLTLKLPSIIFGTLTILGVYLLAKEIFKNERIGLFSSFLVATSFWAINFSRISFRANMLPFILTFSFYFLWKGLRTKKFSDFALGGFIFGLGLHTYIAFRIAPAILIVMFFALILNRKNFLKEYWKQILFFILFILISSSPMLYTFFVSHPEYLESRSSSISIFSPEMNNGHLLKTFFKSFSLSLLKYNLWGDQNWRHNFPPYPLLDPLVGLAFAVGFFYSILKFFHLVIQRIRKNIPNEEIEIYLFLLSSFFFMLAPEFMTAEGNPHALRAIGTLPFVFIFSALTLNYSFKYIENKRKYVFKNIVVLISIIILISTGIFNSIKYHLVWAKKAETAVSFEKNLMLISNYLKTLPDSQEKFVFAESMQRIPIDLFNQNHPEIKYLYSQEIEKVSPKNKNNFIIILTNKNDETINFLLTKFPNLKFEEIKDYQKTSFYVLK